MKVLFLLFALVVTLSLNATAQSVANLNAEFKKAKSEERYEDAAKLAIALGIELYNQRNRGNVTFESVEYSFKEGVRNAIKAKDYETQANANVQLARLYSRKNARSRSEKKGYQNTAGKHLAEAENIYRRIDDTVGVANTQYAMAKIKISLRAYPDAALRMTEAMDFYEKAEDFDKAQDCARELVDIYRWLGNSDKSEFYEEEAVRFSSSSRELAQRDLLIKLKADSLEIQQQSIALKEQEARLLQEENDKQLAIIIGTVGGGILLLVSLFFALRARQKINAQKKEVEKLLLNILPKTTAEELRKKGIATPQSYARVTVLFTDFKGFTQVAEKMSPNEIIEELGVCFSAFDEIIERNHLEKIKTIGDAYMCAGGVPEPNQSNPIDATRAALAMQQFMVKRIEENRLNGKPILELRIGIHTGPVVAGVVGKKKFAYDIWGDAVNVAARMESSGEPNRVNISGETYSLIKDQFKCTHRGKVSAKNKGEIDMYFVEGEQ